MGGGECSTDFKIVKITRVNFNEKTNTYYQ